MDSHFFCRNVESHRPSIHCKCSVMKTIFLLKMTKIKLTLFVDSAPAGSKHQLFCMGKCSCSVFYQPNIHCYFDFKKEANVLWRPRIS